jgi:hypothetical protein
MLVILMKEITKYTVELTSCGMIYVPSFVKIGKVV